ncbi:hypothetical protein Slin15195_G043740 [Septoria linicola]|uniref:Uncharacterized protein n=1 Tax=Septoria linicola TaxID=215465 RepID=A0A9Q9AR70_9PEZI|nr:hypothetical protein Slin14017_G047260 [Septoria linicola]USW51055.1 hypothetical protein Slin15195_G043740 [Septoria linicola]
MHFSITLAITLASITWILFLTYLLVTTDLTLQRTQPPSTSVIVKCTIVLTTYLAIDGPFISAPLLFPPPNPYHLPNAQRQDWLTYQAFARKIEPTLYTSNARNLFSLFAASQLVYLGR